MIQKLLILMMVLPFFCQGQKIEKEYQGDINYKDILEIKGLIYNKADTALVTGKVIKYNRKNEAKKYVSVSKGKPNELGWVFLNDNVEMPKESALGTILTTSAQIVDFVGNDIELPRDNNNIQLGSPISNYLSEQKDNTNRAYRDMMDRNYTSNDINSAKQKSNESNKQNDKDDQIKIKGNDNEERKNGAWEEFYDNGQLRNKGNYLEGKKDGLWEEFYENSQLKSKLKFISGEKSGLYEEYHSNGQLMSIGSYKDGLVIGEWKFYDETGKLLLTVNH